MKTRSSILAGLLLSMSGIVAAAPDLVTSGDDPIPAVFPSTSDRSYDQTDHPSGYGAPDQAFEAGYAAYDSQGADDFVLEEPCTWWVSGVNTPGISQGPSIHVNVGFYADDGGLPGQPACVYPALTDYTDSGGDLSIWVECFLAPGTYWYVQEVRQDYLTSGQHFWSTRSVQSGYPSLWRNPANGFGTGCVDWAPQTTCGVGGNSPDFLFKILASEVDGCPLPPPVPAVGPSGLTLMLLALGGGSGYVLLRRRR